MRAWQGLVPKLLAFLLVVPRLLHAAPPPDSLVFEFIGNEAFHISDGTTTLLTDFPYESGAFGYMTYDAGKIPRGGNVLCLITHGHADHFSPTLFSATHFAIVAPPSLVATLDTPRKIPFAPEMTYEGITITPFRTPHGTIEHYSYLVVWHGLRFYFPGDTDDIQALASQTDLDVAFVTPWQLKAFMKIGKRVDARRIVIYHHRAGEQVPMYQGRRVPRQGDTFSLALRR